MKSHALKILAINLGLCAAAGTLVAQVTVTTLYSFVSISIYDGYNPQAGLVQGSDGNFYGTTLTGGAYVNVNIDDGTVFKISTNGIYANFYSFAGTLTDDGDAPEDNLVQGSDGNFYGTTVAGGANTSENTAGVGTVFRINPITGIETNLYSFGSYTNDGTRPVGGLVLGRDGNFYGTTSDGGTNGYGTVFRISPSGAYTNLYLFAGSPTDGSGPDAGLVLGSDGNFYGTTAGGGTNNAGTVFRISPSGSETVLYSFNSYYGDGYAPEAPLVQGSDGNFYGTTVYGGTHGSYLGTLFRISPGGTYTNLYSFAGYPTDGATPAAPLVQGSDGNFYGTTAQGGTNDDGTIFRISPGGSYTNFYSFAGYPNDGQNPRGLVQGSDGNFYGTTLYGGSEAAGVVYRLTVPLSLAANQISAIQIAGTNVLVSIPSVAGEMYQLQDRDSLTTGAWADVAGQVTSIGGLLTVTNFGGFTQPQQFYRFAITP